MENLIQSPPSIKNIQKQLRSIQVEIKELYLLEKQDNTSEKQGNILKSLKQVEVVLEELFCKQLEYNYKRLLSDIDSIVVPLKLSKQFKEIGLPIIEIVKNAILDDNKHGLKKMTIMVANKLDNPFIDIMRDYGKGFDSTIVHNQIYFDFLGKVSKHGCLVIDVCPLDFGLKKNVLVTLLIY